MIECNPEDLAANRQGQLSAAQRARFERGLRSGSTFWRVLSGLWLLLVVSGVIVNARKHDVAGTIAFGVVFAAIVIVPLLLFGRWNGTRAMRNFQNETVERVTGRLQDYRRGAYGPYCFVAFNGQRMIAPLELIKPFREELASHTFHVYYLKRGGNLLSLEPA